MNYPESKLVLEKIRESERIGLNCHQDPDPDSVGCALALYQVLINMGKKVRILCPTAVDGSLEFLKYFEKIETVDFSTLDFLEFDLFIALDSSSWSFASGMRKEDKIGIPLVVIDHHKSNEGYGDINLLDSQISSTAELLYLVFKGWGVDLNRDIATSLLAGIVGDTGAFQYPGSGADTLKVAGDLMRWGADKDKIIFHIYRSVDFDLLKFWGAVIAKAKLSEDGKFFWSALSFEEFEKLGKLQQGKETSANLFAQIVEGTEFGFVAVEDEKGKLSVSFRSRTGFDTSKIAIELGGGGHVYASGATVEGMPFEEAVEKVQEVCRRHAKS